MPVENQRGLSEAQIAKIEKPYAHNSGHAVDYARARNSLNEFDQKNPTLWQKVSQLLARTQG